MAVPLFRPRFFALASVLHVKRPIRSIENCKQKREYKSEEHVHFLSCNVPFGQPAGEAVVVVHGMGEKHGFYIVHRIQGKFIGNGHDIAVLLALLGFLLKKKKSKQNKNKPVYAMRFVGWLFGAQNEDKKETAYL